ncbi:hypothetical protein, partial [Pseudomonas aeruginosa]|uniref:hypothetical protein n=1 Tax=Pseudomonas aeruginosa TaxID=287 RepID=UPI001E52785A
ARLKTYGALFGDKNHKAFSRFCLCGHEKSGIGIPYSFYWVARAASLDRVRLPLLWKKRRGLDR